ncbi:hypothetical protein F8M41_024613 [Gigaspora margarita]|uniref:Uncharacterized protein n=1 Tax=Gigaspora margarita TaxID=4874 RepID=A0A8H3XNF8_GIGMA|nr:hypothetical protein F8M41_024613 [Gigaspora margarita]
MEEKLKREKNKTSTYYQNSADMELDKETFGLDGGYENGIEEDKSKASEIGFETNKHEAFGPESKRMNIVTYTMPVKGERGRSDSIAVQANIMKRYTEIELTEEVLKKSRTLPSTWNRSRKR